VLHLLAPRELATAAGTGHHVAVADALDYLAREGVGVRRTRRGDVAFLSTTGPVAGQFLHRTSRALDPHLHTHVVLANVAQGVDGRWSGVDSRRLHAHLPAAQSIYHARLRLELGDRMGAAWHVRPSGLGDVVGVDPSLCRLFSGRTASMDEFRFHRTGADRSPAAFSSDRSPAAFSSDRSPAAFYADRPAKDTSVSVEQLLDGWRAQAAEFGFDLGDLTRTVGTHRHDAEPRIDRDGLRHQLVELTRDRRAVRRHHVVAAVAVSIPGGAAGRDVEAVATRLLDASREQDRASGVRDPLIVRWDPKALVRAVDSHRFDRVVPIPGVGDRGTPPVGWAYPGPVVDRGLGRRREVDGPDPLIRSLGLQR
jgi:conjugative relaxase-like TrwC/TraI family protein